MAGIAAALPDHRVVCVEPEGSRAVAAGLEAGHSVPVEPRSIADGLSAPFAGEVALRVLRERGVRSVLVEGGPTVASAFVRAGLVDDYLIYLAPTLIGGARTALDDLGVGTIDDQRRLRVADVTLLGTDLLVVARDDTRSTP